MEISEIADSIVALCTIVLTYLTFRNVKLTHEILKAGEDASNEESRPYIIANIYSEDLHINLSIQNIGKRPAKDVSIIITPSLDTITAKDKNGELLFDSSSLLNQVFMPPDFQTTTIVNYNQQFYTLENIPDFKVLITYKDFNDNPYNDHYTISLKYLSTKKTAQYSKDYNLRKIAGNIKDLTTEIQKKK